MTYLVAEFLQTFKFIISLGYSQSYINYLHHSFPKVDKCKHLGSSQIYKLVAIEFRKRGDIFSIRVLSKREVYKSIVIQPQLQKLFAPQFPASRQI